MTSKTIELTRKDYNLIAKNRGIKEPQNVFTKELLNTYSRYNRKYFKKYKIFQKMN